MGDRDYPNMLIMCILWPYIEYDYPLPSLPAGKEFRMVTLPGARKPAGCLSGMTGAEITSTSIKGWMGQTGKGVD
jgi:hypothetical protein